MKGGELRAEELLQVALQLPAGERAAFIRRIADPELRAQVALLLADDSVRPNEPSPGSMLDHFRVEREIGRGGMGVVYLAEDMKLGRRVALKLLPAAFHRDIERVRRFEREARTAAALNHGNILTVFEVGEWEGRSFLATEFVEGETLAKRLTRGPLSAAEATRIGGQILEGLAVAHQAGIIHRDLKPANIMLRPDGTAKVLDFGLARLVQPSGAPDSLDETISQTAPNCVMGTPGYVAPEQWQGRPADARSDLYSFGCVLYEMLTGARVGPQLQRIAPPALGRIVSRCLEADPAMRWPSAAELAGALGRATGARSSGRKIVLAAAGVLLAASAAVAWYFRGARGPVTSPSEYVQLTNFNDTATAPVLSRDGRILAFMRGGTYFLGVGQVYVKLLPDGESKQLTDEQRPKYGLAFTPDGSRVTYTTLTPGVGAWTTWAVPVMGGPPTQLMANAAGLSWIGPERILFSEVMKGTALHMGIVTSKPNREDERQIYFPPHERAMAHYSWPSPDQHSILIVEMDGAAAWQSCRLVPMEGGSAGKQVGPPGACTAAAWSPDGRWMYFNVEMDGSTHLWRQRFPNGPPEQITFGPTEEEGLAVAPDGKALIASIGNRRGSVWTHDSSGEHAIALEGSASAPRLSADGKRLYYLLRKSSTSDANELWKSDLATGRAEAVLGGRRILDYVISRDETRAAFTAASDGGPAIFVAALDRSSPPRLVTRAGDFVSFGAEGQLVYRQLGEKSNYLTRIQEDGTGLTHILEQPIIEKQGVSPGGDWVTIAGAVLDPVSGKFSGTVAVSIQEPTRRKMICKGPCLINWSADGRYLYVTTHRAWTSAGRTLVVPLPHGFAATELPAGGIDRASDEELAGVGVILGGQISPGPDPQMYAYAKAAFEGNLFRIPLH